MIENAARETGIVDLANFLNAMGAKVRGAGTGTIRIEGVDFLRGTTYTVIPDRIEAGTYMVAAAITRGEVFVEGAISDHLGPVIAKMREMGIHVMEGENGVHVRAEERSPSGGCQTFRARFPRTCRPIHGFAHHRQGNQRRHRNRF